MFGVCGFIFVFGRFCAREHNLDQKQELHERSSAAGCDWSRRVCSAAPPPRSAAIGRLVSGQDTAAQTVEPVQSTDSVLRKTQRHRKQMESVWKDGWMAGWMDLRPIHFYSPDVAFTIHINLRFLDSFLVPNLVKHDFLINQFSQSWHHASDESSGTRAFSK